jgi:putative membrane protein
MKTNYRTTYRILPCLAMMVTQFALVSIYAADTSENRGEFSAADYKFAKAAACGGMLEVNLGNLATASSRNPAVQQFGERMAKDHGKAGQDLAQIALRKGASLPTELTPRQQKEVDRLTKLSGPEFDKAYVSFMVKCHKTDEKEFKRASDEVQDPDLKSFAETKLPMVQDHLKAAQDLDQSIKGEVSLNN